MNFLQQLLGLLLVAISAFNVHASEREEQSQLKSKNKQKRENRALYKQRTEEDKKTIQEERKVQKQTASHTKSTTHIKEEKNEEIESSSSTSCKHETARLLAVEQKYHNYTSDEDNTSECDFKDAQDPAKMPITPESSSSKKTTYNKFEGALEDDIQATSEIEALEFNQFECEAFLTETEEFHKEKTLSPVSIKKDQHNDCLEINNMSVDELSEAITSYDNEIHTINTRIKNDAIHSLNNEDDNDKIFEAELQQQLLKLKKERTEFCQAYNEKYASENKDDSSESPYTREDHIAYRKKMFDDFNLIIYNALTTKEEIQLHQDEFTLSKFYFDQYLADCEKLLQEKIAQRKYWIYEKLTIAEKALLLAQAKENQKRAKQIEGENKENESSDNILLEELTTSAASLHSC